MFVANTSIEGLYLQCCTLVYLAESISVDTESKLNKINSIVTVQSAFYCQKSNPARYVKAMHGVTKRTRRRELPPMLRENYTARTRVVRSFLVHFFDNTA